MPDHHSAWGQHLIVDLAGQQAREVEAVVGKLRLLRHEGDPCRGVGLAERLSRRDAGDAGAEHHSEKTDQSERERTVGLHVHAEDAGGAHAAATRPWAYALPLMGSA